MKSYMLATALGLCLISASSARAIPLGEERPPVQLGPLVSVRDVVLYDKIVVTSDGHYLGWVENVDYIGSFVTQIKVSFDFYRRAAWIFVEHIKYDPKNNVVVTDWSPERVRSVSFLD